MKMKLIQFGFLLLFNVLATSCYEMSTCPTAILWDRRAAKKCDSKWYYHCLYDALNSNATYIIHQERCITKPKRYKGKRFVFNGNLNAINCSSDRYTPEPTWSNTFSASECPFKKSVCVEEGQVIVDNGTSKTDRSCRCNYKLGYDYVVKPFNPCRCKPFQEDCSCYIHRCSQKLEILSPDYGCVENPLTIGKFVCSEITDQMDYSDNTNISAETEFDGIEENSIRNNGPVRYAMFILMPLGTLTALFVWLVLKKLRDQQDNTVPKTFSSGSTPHVPEDIENTVPPTVQPSTTTHVTIEVQLSMTVRDSNTVVLNCQLPVPNEIKKVAWKFISGESVKEIPSASTEKYDNYTVSSPSLIIKNCKASDSGTYNLLVNNIYNSEIKVFIPEEMQLSMTVRDSNIVVLNCQLPVPNEIKKIAWIFISGETVKEIPSASTEKYDNYSVSSPSLIIRNCKASDSGTYKLLVNSIYNSEIKVCIPEEIYREPMNIVPYYQETKQLKEIERALRLEDKKLVILKGKPGSGKTQTASKFCERYRMMYSIVATLSLRDGLSLKQSLLELLEDKLEWQCDSKDKEISFAALLENIQNYFNYGDRTNLPFILIVDNIGQSENVSNISNFVSLIENVSRLNIILVLTSGEYLSELNPFCHSLIEFNGMDMDEYMGLFNHLIPGGKVDDFKSLVNVIGNTPMILATVLKYMKNMNDVSASYLEKYNSIANQMISCRTNDFYSMNQSVVNSHMLPLEQIKCTSVEVDSPGNFLWKVMSLIPFLEYGAVSPVVLRACYRHLLTRTHDKEKAEINTLMEKLISFSLCQKSLMSEGDMYSFHQVTINTIELMENISVAGRTSKLDFLLKLFCSEIDIDAGSDITLARNLLFVPHAKKLLSDIGIKFDRELSPEQNFLISYLYCAIGSTLLYKQTNGKDAHVALMKAHHFALAVIDQESLATDDKCLRQDSSGHLREKEAEDVNESTFQDILKFEFSNEFAKKFALSKRRNEDDLINIRSAIREKSIDNRNVKAMNISENHYLTIEEYNELEKLNLALSINNLSKIMLAELVLNILLNNADALHQVSCAKCFSTDRQDEQTSQRLITGIDTEVKRTQDFCDKLKKFLYESLHLESKVQLFVCLKSDSIGQFLVYKYSKKSSDTPSDKIAFFEELLKNKNTESFDFGVIKLAKTRFMSYCQKIIVEYFSDKIKQEQNNERKMALYAEGRTKVKTLRSQVEKMKKGDRNYTWLFPTEIYIKCGDFLSQAEDDADIRDAITCFDNALAFETSRKAYGTLYIVEAYKGKIRCLRKLNQNPEVEMVTREVTNMIRGQNRDEYLSYILQIFVN